VADESHASVVVNNIYVASGSTSGAINLSIGVNTITIQVTAQDGTLRTYTVIVTRLSNDATLSNITLSAGTIAPAFNSGTTSYTANVLNSVSSVTVTPTVHQGNATVTVNGTAVSSGAASGPINLNVGDNTITLIVTAQDGATRAVYMVTVTRAAPLTTTTSTTTTTTTATPPVITTVTGTGNVDVSKDIDTTGKFIGPVVVKSADTNATITIPAGITGTTAEGQPLSTITISNLSAPPAPPSGENIISLPYEFGPTGAHFSAPISITFNYDPSLLAAGSIPSVYWYNTSSGKWEQLTTISIDSINHTITASVNHFSVFAVLAALATTTTTSATTAVTTATNPDTTGTISTLTTGNTNNSWLVWVIIGIAAVLVILVVSIGLSSRRKTKS
jgi:tRNA threonylcarbamoyladenosine modification (KEOPS) complex  Pcc1 subunit